MKAAETAARSLSLQHHVVEVQDPSQYDTAFQALRREGADALLMLSNQAFFSERHRIAELPYIR